MKVRDSLIKLDMYYNHDTRKVIDTITKHVFVEELDSKEFNEFYKKELSSMKKRKVKCLTILDKDYPEELKKIVLPPLVLYYTGDIKILSKAIQYREYSYITGPNKFGLDEAHLITNKFNIITFGNMELNLWTDRRPFINKIMPLIAKNIICTRKIKTDDASFMLIVTACGEYNYGNDIYVVPTLDYSINNDIINEFGAYLLDSKERIFNSKC